MNKFLTTTLCAVLFFGMGTSITYAIPFQNAIIQVNADSPIIDSAADVSYTGAAVNASLTGSKNYTGTDGNGNAATMELTYNGAAQVSADGALKSRISANLSSPFFNPSVNGTNIPESFYASSTALYADVFNVSGSTALSHVQFSLALDGTLSERDSFAEATGVSLFQGGSFSTFGGNSRVSLLHDNGLFGNDFDVDVLLATGLIPVVNGQAEMFLELVTSVQFNLFQALPTGALDGQSDFFNTLVIKEVSGFDANGNPVDLESIAGSTGFQFSTVRVDTNNVPEPGTLALFFMGLAGFGFMRYRKYN